MDEVPLYSRTSTPDGIKGFEPDRLYRGTPLMGNDFLLGPYSRTIPRVLWGS